MRGELMKHFITKKFLAVLALVGALVFAGTTPAVEATVEISAMVKMQT